MRMVESASYVDFQINISFSVLAISHVQKYFVPMLLALLGGSRDFFFFIWASPFLFPLIHHLFLASKILLLYSIIL